MDQAAIHFVDILADGLKRRPLVCGKGNKKVVQSPQRFSKRELKLLEARRVLLGINNLSVQLFLAGFSLVAILLENGEGIRQSLCEQIAFYLPKFCVAQLGHELGLPDRIRLVGETRAEFRDSVRRFIRWSLPDARLSRRPPAKVTRMPTFSATA